MHRPRVSHEFVHLHSLVDVWAEDFVEEVLDEVAEVGGALVRLPEQMVLVVVQLTETTATHISGAGRNGRSKERDQVSNWDRVGVVAQVAGWLAGRLSDLVEPPVVERWSLERRESCQLDEEHHAARPDVGGHRVVALLREHLRSLHSATRIRMAPQAIEGKRENQLCGKTEPPQVPAIAARQWHARPCHCLTM